MRLFTLVALGALWCVGTTAWAQDARVDVRKGGVNVDVNAKGMAEKGQIVRARDVTRLSVYNANDQSLGKIEDLVLDLRTGKIRYAVLSFGGILGMGDKYFAVPWQKLSFVPKGETTAGTQKESYCVLDISKDTLKTAPGFDKRKWPDFADNNWRQTIERYYGGHRAASGERNPQR